MIRPNWDKFKTKFSGSPQTEFERLCYFLFCQEFDKPLGIFRYKNQSGMETDPVRVGDDYISWEAKFYKDKLSDHERDFIEKLATAKKKNPEVTKMFFYTPIDRTESSKKYKRKTTPQERVEARASKLGIEITWRGASFFEIVCSHQDNQQIARHCFSTDNSIIEFLDKRQMHTEAILSAIQTRILFNGQKIEIDRNDLLLSMQEKITNGQILIISGTAGVGKTALVKLLYNRVTNNVPFYFFNTSEFAVNSVDEIFKDVTLKDFVDAHQDEENKIIVVDSAEKLLDIANTDPFKEFLSVLIQNNWKIIFTARNSYFSDLNNELIDRYGITPSKFHIENITEEELVVLSKKYIFNLPKDNRLIALIRNPLYLNKYLNFYRKEDKIDYLGFKKRLWDEIIVDHKPSRETCFLDMSFKRANDGLFFIEPCCESNVLDDLVKKEVLGHETDGYFITHDIYEEWALEKIIEREFKKASANLLFFESIGTSLAIRRAFRNRISEKLFLKDKSVEQFIEECIEDDQIESFWKEEILVSILLSDYSVIFFDLFKKKLLDTNNELLKRLASLLKLACKELDDSLLNLLNMKNIGESSLRYLFTKPKGNGWNTIIKFIHGNLNIIGVENIGFILPIIFDWNNKFHSGETTRLSSLIALRYYEWMVSNGGYFSRDDDYKKKLFRTILYGSREIKEELVVIFDNVLKNNWNGHRDPYYDLINTILSPEFSNDNLLMYYVNMPDCYQVIKILPSYVLKLANLFWFQHNDKEEDSYSSSVLDRDSYFGLENGHLDYFPSSSYQTPIFWLLESSLKETVDFILEFTNKCVEYYANSKDQLENVNIYIDKEPPIKQYIDTVLRNMYRGTQTSSHVLESIHMALEKYFIEQGKECPSDILEKWLIYLLRNSKSASISSIVTSIVLAYPEKTFNVAKILFQTKSFFLYDTSRLFLDKQAKSIFGLGFGLNLKSKIYEEERIKTRDDNHRKKSLEHLAFTYQLVGSEEITEHVREERQEIIWKILDKYYVELPKSSKNVDSDKPWRLCLARMDRRKMSFKTTQTEDGIILHSEPKMDPELKEYSEKALKKSTEPIKYLSLGLWASNKMSGDEKYKQYQQYELNPKLALKEVKQVIDKLKNSKDKDFCLINRNIPGDVCSVLIKHHFKMLSQRDKVLCKDVIIEIASLPLKTDFQYQMIDGIGSAISVLPILLKEFPNDMVTIKTILLLTLFNTNQIGFSGAFGDFSIGAILHKLWEIDFDSAQSLLFGYLLLLPEYKTLKKSLRDEKYKKGIYDLKEKEVVGIFLKKYRLKIKKIIDNEMSISDLKNIEQLELYGLRTVLLLIPRRTTNRDHKKIVKIVISVFSKALLSNEKLDRIELRTKKEFLEKFASFVLTSPMEDIHSYLKPFLDGFCSSEIFADLFKEFVSQEDRLNTYDNFWKTREIFYPKLVALCKSSGSHSYIGKIIKGYLFAQNEWISSASNRHSLKEGDKWFFKKIIKDIGDHPATLFSLSKLLNNIGSPFLEDGISWIASILEHNKNLWTEKIDNDTIYYLENLVKKYAHSAPEKIKKMKKTKYEVLRILDFLVEKKSETGYLLREHIL